MSRHSHRQASACDTASHYAGGRFAIAAMPPRLAVDEAALVSTQKVVIDNCPRFRKHLLFCESRDVIRLCSQESRTWIYVRLPTRSALHGAQRVSSILNIIRFGHGRVSLIGLRPDEQESFPAAPSRGRRRGTEPPARRRRSAASGRRSGRFLLFVQPPKITLRKRRKANAK